MAATVKVTPIYQTSTTIGSRRFRKPHGFRFRAVLVQSRFSTAGFLRLTTQTTRGGEARIVNRHQGGANESLVSRRDPIWKIVSQFLPISSCAIFGIQ